jgi:putative transcriptional regulator
MNSIRQIRERLGLTQAALGAAIGCTQGNVSFYEKGQTVPPDAAKALIAHANANGLAIHWGHIYGDEQLPPAPEPAQPEAAQQGV